MKNPSQETVEQVISEAIEWASDVLRENGIDPDSMDADKEKRLLDSDEITEVIRWLDPRASKGPEELDDGERQRFERELKRPEFAAIRALLVLDEAEELRKRLHRLDADLALSLLYLYRMPREYLDDLLEPYVLAGQGVFFGGEKGGAASRKLTPEIINEIRKERAAAKRGAWTNIKNMLARKYKMHPRSVERATSGKN